MRRDAIKGRILTCGAVMALWLATLAGQTRVVTEAMAGPPALTEFAFRLGIASIIPHVPGLLVLGVVCAVFRSACYIGLLRTEEASSVVVLIGDAAFYFVITYWIARGILKSAAAKVLFVLCGGCVLLANGVLTRWMVWAEKPYYVHPMPRLSICSLALGTLTFLSAFWPVRSNAVVRS
jgi:hypothetical protein